MRPRIVLVGLATTRAFEVYPGTRFLAGSHHSFTFLLISFLQRSAGRPLGYTEDGRVDGTNLTAVRAGDFYSLLWHTHLHEHCTADEEN